MSTNAPECGWDQAVFRCGRCGAQNTATTEADYLKAIDTHSDAHAVWDRLNPIERDGITSILRTILSAPELALELLALADRQSARGQGRQAAPPTGRTPTATQATAAPSITIRLDF
ncbi:hypothetical protein [Streptomyces drozdowiczii]|uniref:Uncharacterized protein n=1 Tax=Streptomyces drozdowiczii TaxID=202862 RepID=A0ABY6Q1T4_9ACTN|nr:hypothetical protein [Streptomyces drozdowiczii]MCX0247978.1 hypothetical protein [Streptomyces drozdowiczii]UZK58240.1 hypothetical protein NEH16_32900 [Streptomyces drozdowiczii]